MIFNLNNFSIKFKLLMVAVIFVFGMFISFIGMIEIFKIEKLKDLVREHIEYIDIFIDKSEELIYLIEDSKFSSATNLINNNSLIIKEMGSVDLIIKIKSITKEADNIINVIEKIIFKLVGFGKIFDLIKEDIENCGKLETNFFNLKIKDFKNIDSELSFLIKYLNEIEDKEDEFELIIIQTSSFVKNTILILLIVISLILITLLYYISKNILYSIENFEEGLIDFFAYLNHEREYVNYIKVNSNDEFKKMIDVVNGYIKFTSKNISENINILKKVANEDYSVKMKVRGDVDKFAQSMNIMIDKLKENKISNDEEKWLKNGINTLNKKLSRNLNLEQLSNIAITFISKYLRAVMGVIYIKDGEYLNLIGKYAFVPKDGLLEKYKLGDGVIGQVGLQKSKIILKNSKKRDLYTYTYPLVYEDKLYGVIEVAIHIELKEVNLKFLKSTNKVISAYLFIATEKGDK